MTATCRRRAARKNGAIWLLTGPNMGGKSTFLRQNALIAILAQMGSFVPADERAYRRRRPAVFSRVGASDDLARGRSTFMVEMVETAAILNQAGERVAGHPRRDRPRHRDLRRPVDRLGGGRISAREEPLPGDLRHAFPRDDGARRKAAAAAQRHHAGQGMGGRRGLPARGRQGRGRPLLRRAGGAARRPAGRRGAARARTCCTSSKPARRRARPTAWSTTCRCFRPLRRETPPPAKTDALGEALAAINPDEMTPREALEALYRLKGLGGG